MRSPVLIASLVSGWALAGVGAPAAPAASQLVLRDSHIAAVYALGTTLVYSRSGSPGHPAQRAWMRRVGGRVLRARGVPTGASASAIGRDPSGRVVLTLRTSRGWWIYDVARDRADRVRGLPTGSCAPIALSVWRARLAYGPDPFACSNAGIFLRERHHTRRLTRQGLAQGSSSPLALRGDTLVAAVDEADGDSSVVRLVADGKACRLSIAGSFVPAEWSRLGVWLDGGTAMWWVAGNFGTEPGALTGTQLRGCARPRATGDIALPGPAPSPTTQRSIDGRWLYYAGAGRLLRQRLPAAPHVSPPANDDFQRATPLATNPPISIAQTIGNATFQAGEPSLLYATTRTVWFAFRPTASQRVAVAGGPAGYGAVGVFEGSGIDSLTPVATRGPLLQWDAIADHTYRIVVGCSGLTRVAFSCYLPFKLRITTVGS